MGHRLTIVALSAIFLAGTAQGAYEPAGVVRDFVDLTDYLPVGEPNMLHHDNSAGAQTLATTLCARQSNGGRIFVPAVKAADYYVFHDILNSCGNTWEGDGASGVGDLHQPGTATSFVSLGGTAVNYSAATSYFMEWQVPNFPAFKSNAHLNGGGINGFTLIDNSSTATTLKSLGTQDWKATNLIVNGAYNIVYMKGVEFPYTGHISAYGTRNKNYEIVGDLTGQTQAGGACAASSGDCSTRDDVWFGDYLTNIDNKQTNTVFTITGFVATTTLSHTSGEGPAYGMVASCPAGMSFGQCPSFGRMDDNQFEFVKYTSVSLTDTTGFQFTKLYAVNDASSNNLNNFYASSLNYSDVNEGNMLVRDSVIFATWQDSIYLGGTMNDLEFINNHISAGNTANNNYNAISVNGNISDLKIIHNTIGAVNQYGGAHPYNYAVRLATGVFSAQIADNFFNPSGGVGYAFWNGSSYIQVSPIYNASTTPSLIHIGGNLGPGGPPALSACGTAPGVTGGFQDSDFVAQTGGSVGSSCLATFGSIQPSPPVCVVTPYAGGSSSIGVTPTITGVTISSGSSLSGALEVHCSTMDK